MEKPNLSYIKEMSGGDQSFENKIIQIIRDELPLEIQAYQKSISALDFTESAAHVHKLKHKISIFGLSMGYALADQHEKELLGHNAQYQDDFAEILNEMSEFIKRI